MNKAMKTKWVLLGQSDEPIKAKNLQTGNVIKSVIANGDIGGSVDNSDKSLELDSQVNTEQKLNEYQVALNKMQQEINDLHNLLEEKKKYNPMNWIVAIFGLSFLFFLFAVFLNRTFNFGISDNGIVLAFVGIAATFIVVSNYAQVKDIELKFEKYKDDIQKQNDRLKHNLEEQNKQYRCESIGTALFNLAEAMKDMKMYSHAFTGYIKALSELYCANSKSNEVNMCFDNINSLMEQIKSKNKAIQMDKFYIQEYINLIGEINDNRKFKIIDFIKDNFTSNNL
jgi:tetratricopeptide (TPR) repeat protein